MFESESIVNKILSGLQRWLRKNRLYLLGMLAWTAVCVSAFVWAFAPREGAPMTLLGLVKKLELSPKLISFPARGEVNWEIQRPIQKMYKIRGELESVDAFASWHYRVQGYSTEGEDYDIESHIKFVNTAVSWNSERTEFQLSDEKRLYRIILDNNEDSEGCSFLITTVPIRKEPIHGE